MEPDVDKEREAVCSLKEELIICREQLATLKRLLSGCIQNDRRWSDQPDVLGREPLGSQSAIGIRRPETYSAVKRRSPSPVTSSQS